MALGRRQRLAILALIIAIGVGGLVAVQSVVGDLQAQVGRQARSLLGADVEVTLPAELTGEQRGVLAAAERGGGFQEVGIASMILEAGGPQAMVQVRGVDPDRYPWYGTLALQPARSLPELLPPDGVVVTATLAAQQGLGVGERIILGERELTVTAILQRDPFAAAHNPLAGPPVLLARETLRAMAPSHQRLGLVRLPLGAAGAELHGSLKTAFGSRLRDYSAVAEETQKGLQRTAAALTLMATIALVLGGLCVASTVRAFIVESTEEVAMWKVLGTEPPSVLAIFAVQLLPAAGLGTLLGAGLGLLVRNGVVRLLADRMPVELAGTAPSVWPVLGGVLVGMAVCMLAAWPSLASLNTILPSWILRVSDTEPGRIPPGTAAAALVGVLALMLVLSGSVGTGLAFLLGLGLVTLLLWVGSRIILLLLQAIPVRWHGWHLAKRNLQQKGALTAVVALSVGSFLLAGLGLVQGSLLTSLRATGGSDLLPNLYLLQVPGREKQEVKRFLETQGGSTVLPSFAITTGRVGLGQREFSALVFEATEFVPIAILEGENLAPGRFNSVLLRKDEAEEWGLEPGDKLWLTVENQRVEYRVAGIWERDGSTKGWYIQIDAPIVVPTGLLGADAPHVIPMRVQPASVLDVQRAVAGRYPGILPLSLDDLLRAGEGVLNSAALMLRYLSSLALLTGAVATAGAVAATQLQKRREVAVLKVIGFSQVQIVGSQVLENLALGAAASLAGASLALLLFGGLGALVTGAGPSLNLVLQTLFAWPAGTGLLAAVAGVLPLAGIFKQPPLETLKAEG